MFSMLGSMQCRVILLISILMVGVFAMVYGFSILITIMSHIYGTLSKTNTGGLGAVYTMLIAVGWFVGFMWLPWFLGDGFLKRNRQRMLMEWLEKGSARTALQYSMRNLRDQLPLKGS